jgi:uncharacterized membrane protein/CBS domain-containing protein
MKARDVMSRDAECVAASETLESAARRLTEAGVGSMPICGDDDRLKGMLTDRDIVVKAVAKGKDLARTLAGELAEGKPVTIGADDSVRAAIRTMRRTQLRRLPVIDGHRLVGMVSQADIARSLSHRQAGRLLAGVSKSRRRTRWLPLVLLAGAGAAWAVPWRRMRSGAKGIVVADTVVAVPVEAAYEQWTQFEEFPSFMGGVEEVRKLDDTHLHWRARVAGKEREWDARIAEQEPNRKITWRSTSGARNDGTVQFEAMEGGATRVKVEIDFEPESMTERIGSAIGLPTRHVQADLERFRELIEGRGGPSTGAWRDHV